MTTEPLWSNHVDPDPEPQLPPRSFEVRGIEARDFMFPDGGGDHLLRITESLGGNGRSTSVQRLTLIELAALYVTIGEYLEEQRAGIIDLSAQRKLPPGEADC